MKSNIISCRLFTLFLLCIFATSISIAQQCQAITKKGTQCKRKAQVGSIYCYQHKAMYEKEPSQNATPTKPSSPSQKAFKQPQQRMNETYSGQCQAITKKGKQCSRRAKPGSKFCWQHGG